MASSFKPLSIVNQVDSVKKQTPDVTYWKNFEFPVTRKQHAGVTHIDFNSADPFQFAVTSSVRVEVFKGANRDVWKTLSKFHETAYSGSLRPDGRLLVAGSDEPLVRLFDVSSKTILRIFQGHRGPVHLSRFLSDGLHVYSGSDDKTVNVYDITSETPVSSYAEFQDHIRAGCEMPRNSCVFAAGSYDHTVRLFDTRTDHSTATIDHGQPVESVLFHPAGSLLFTAGGPVVKVWDILAGGKQLAVLANHHKTVTSLCLCSGARRLASASLDRHVKIYDMASYQVVHTLDYPSPILSVGCAPDDSVLVVGMADGLLSIQYRKDEEAETAAAKEVVTKKKFSRRPAFLATVKTKQPNVEDQVISVKHRERMAKYDLYFKKFQHTSALDAALDLRVRNKTPEVTIGVMQELMRRGGLRAALAGRDEASMAVIVRFLQRHVSNPRYASAVIDVANIFLDIYSEQIGQSVIYEHMRSLKATIDNELSYCKTLLELGGALDLVVAAAQQ